MVHQALAPLRSLALSFAMTLAAFSTTAQAAPDYDAIVSEMEAVFEGLADDEQFHRELIKRYNVPTDKAHLMLEHAALLFSEEGFPAFLAREMIAAFPDYAEMEPKHRKPLAQEFGSALIQSKIADGVKRLSPSDQRRFYRDALVILREIPVSTCAGSMKMTVSAVEAAEVEMAAVFDQDDAFIERYLASLRKAAFAEIFDDPVYLPLAASERKLAQRRYENAFVDALDQHPRADALYEAADMMADDIDADVCEVGLMAIETALEIDGTIGDWVLKYMSE